MTEKQSDIISKSLKALTRRAFLPWMIAGVTGIGFASIFAFRRSSLSQPPAKFRLCPYFTKPKKVRSAPQLTPGFYLNPESSVIHYVPEGKKPRYTGGMDARRLQPKDPLEAAILSVKSGVSGVNDSPANGSAPAKTPRVNPDRLSYSFEQAAISELKQNSIDKACELLLNAIQYEQQYVGGYSASFRLYDLLAGVSVRFNKLDYLERMVAVIAKTRGLTAQRKLADRLNKWRDPNSRWRKRWSDRSKQVQWKADQVNGLVF